MSFLECVMKGGNSRGVYPVSFRITVIGKGCILIEGALKIIKLTSGEVSVRLNGAVAIVNGERLKIKSFADGDLVLIGDVKSIEMV